MINNIPQLPEMVITKADNHPIWINGTELVNGMPIITDNHKDETRLNEFIAAGFTPQYIRWLTVNDPRYRVDNHSPCPKRSYPPKSVSYAGIKAETQVWARGDDPIIAVIQGTSVSLVCVGVSYCVCSAPAGKSKTIQDKFCRAVVRSFLDDPENVWDYVPLYAVPEKAPAEIEDLSLPEPCTFEELQYMGQLDPYDEYEITGHPNAELVLAGKTLYPVIKDHPIRIDEELSEMELDEIYNNVSLDQENNPERADEIINAFCTIPAGTYYPHIRCYIQEVPA